MLLLSLERSSVEDCDGNVMDEIHNMMEGNRKPLYKISSNHGADRHGAMYPTTDDQKKTVPSVGLMSCVTTDWSAAISKYFVGNNTEFTKSDRLNNQHDTKYPPTDHHNHDDNCEDDCEDDDVDVELVRLAPVRNTLRNHLDVIVVGVEGVVADDDNDDDVRVEVEVVVVVVLKAVSSTIMS